MENKNRMAEELVKLFKHVDYDETVCTIKEQYAVPIQDFEKLEIAKWFTLDTSKCFTAKWKLKINKLCLYDIFASYCGKDQFEVKELMRAEITQNWQWFNHASCVCLAMKYTDLVSWFKKQKYKNAKPDELSLYALSILFRHHTIVYNMYHSWNTVSSKPGLAASVIEETCETHLLYLGGSLFGELFRKNLSIPQAIINLDEVQAARVLKCNNNIPELYLEHVNRTDLNTANVEIPVNLQSYVSPSDTTRILSNQPTVFDESYITVEGLEPKPEPNDPPDVTYTITESMGSTLGEITFQDPNVKTEVVETAEEIITQHSPQCELRMHITNIVSLQQPSRSPASMMEYSTDSTILRGIVMPQAHRICSSSPSEASSQELTAADSQDATLELSSQDATCTDDPRLYVPWVPNISTTVHSQDVTPDLSLQDATQMDTSQMKTVSAPITPTTLDFMTMNSTAESSIATSNIVNTSLVSQDVTAIDQALIDFTSNLQEVTTQTGRASNDLALPISTNQMDYTSENDLSSSRVISIVPETNSSGVNSYYSMGLLESNATADLQDVTMNIVPGKPESPEPVVNITRNLAPNQLTNRMIVSIPSPSHVELSDASTIEYSPDMCDAKGSAQESQLENTKATSSSPLPNSRDREAEKVKRHLLSLGLSESLYSSNSGTYYPVLTPEQDEIDYISFKDIMNMTWSINVENMSADDIASELEYIKRTYQPTSSPKPDDTSSSFSTGKTSMSSITDNEHADPTYGVPKKVKKSLRPGRKPSSMRIAAQKIICRTKAVKHTSLKSPASTIPKMSITKSPPKYVHQRKGFVINNQRDPNSILQGKDVSDSPVKKQKNGLKITTHELRKPMVVKKGRHCTCNMCGNKCKSSPAFIEHYKTTHPALKCKDCGREYNNPLSLQKHRYVHSQDKQEKCESCGRTFPFLSQLVDHRKSHLKQHPHVCSHIGCGKDFTHRYDLCKHE